MSVPPSFPTPADQPSPRLLSTKGNESLKLTAAAFDRLSTVEVGGAILAPIFQHQDLELDRLLLWASGALFLHSAAHFMLSLLEEEA